MWGKESYCFVSFQFWILSNGRIKQEHIDKYHAIKRWIDEMKNLIIIIWIIFHFSETESYRSTFNIEIIIHNLNKSTLNDVMHILMWWDVIIYADLSLENKRKIKTRIKTASTKPHQTDIFFAISCRYRRKSKNVNKNEP